MSHLILAKMIQVYHVKKGVAFDCSGRFGGTSLNDKARQLSCYKGQTWRIDLWVLLAVSPRTSHIRELHWYNVLSIKSGCLRTLERDFLRFLCWSQWNLKSGFLRSPIPMQYGKIRFSQTLPGWRPWLTCSKTVTFKLLSILFFSKFFRFFIFFKFKGINLSLSPQGWGNCTHFRRHGWVFDEFAGHNWWGKWQVSEGKIINAWQMTRRGRGNGHNWH